MTVKIKEIEVGGFGSIKKVANTLHLPDTRVNLCDDGVTAHYYLSNNNEIVFDGGKLDLANEDLASWTNTDTQLLDVILNKLGLEKAPVEEAPEGASEN